MKEKCALLQLSVEYLGRLVDGNGLHTLPSKAKAIIQVHEPAKVQQMKSFLWLLNYCSKFVANLSNILSPLNHLPKQNVRWKWVQKWEAALKLAS